MGLGNTSTRNSVIFPCAERTDLLSRVLESSPKVKKKGEKDWYKDVKHGINIKQHPENGKTNTIKSIGKGIFRSKANKPIYTSIAQYVKLLSEFR